MFTESVASYISAWLTVSLTVERCLVIYKPLQTLTDTRGKRALVMIICVVLASCTVNSLFLQPGFFVKRLEIVEFLVDTFHVKKEEIGNSFKYLIQLDTLIHLGIFVRK
jgi:hypothetical protein